MAHYPELNNKVAIITGGSTGIGKAIARDLIDEGVRVMIGALRNRERAQQTVAELSAGGGEIDRRGGEERRKG